MRDCKNIQVDETVIHIVNPRGMGFVPSEIHLPLHGNEKLRDYFTNHIRASIHEATATAARFRNLNSEATSGLCAGLFDGTVDFIDGTTKIASILYGILEQDERTKGADLAICFYRAENYPNHRFLALLKIDPSQVFQHEIQEDEHGREFVNFVLQPQAFTREKLQKCAFIRPLEPRHSVYDMILLDKQVRDVAKYFARDFLDAEDAYDAKERTERLYKSLVRAQNKLRTELTPAERVTLDVQVRSIIRSRRFNANEWLSSLRLPQYATEQLEQTIFEALPDREFELDEQLGEKLVAKRFFRGDYELKVQIPAEHFDDVITEVEYVEDEQGRAPYYRVTIETQKWDETLR